MERRRGGGGSNARLNSAHRPLLEHLVRVPLLRRRVVPPHREGPRPRVGPVVHVNLSVDLFAGWFPRGRACGGRAAVRRRKGASRREGEQTRERSWRENREKDERLGRETSHVLDEDAVVEESDAEADAERAHDHEALREGRRWGVVRQCGVTARRGGSAVVQLRGRRGRKERRQARLLVLPRAEEHLRLAVRLRA